EFLQGLRDRSYYDYALLYLETLGADTSVPKDIRDVVPYEKAATLLLMARSGTITNPEVQSRQLDQALGFLEEFIKNSPNHPRAGEANTERAGILLGKGRVEVWQSRSPSNKENRAEFQKVARDYVLQARAIYQKAHDQHKATWEAFPKFIDQVEEPQKFTERRQAEVRYIVAQLDLAHCLYEEAQTSDQGSDEYKAKLRDAAAAYEEIHSKYRSQIGGLYARTWQGKCYEEQDDIQRALGIYKELLGHPGSSETLVRLQDQVRHFRLICLNHEQRKDYQLVIDEATEWLNAAKGRKKYSPQSLGIRWEQVLAQEKLAEDRNLPEKDRSRLLTAALTTVRVIKRFPGQYKDLATFKERDLNVKLRGDGANDEPQDFDTAFSLGQELATKKTKPLLDGVRTAQATNDKEKIQTARTDLDQHLERARSLLRLALRLSDEDTPISDLNLARYYLSYMHLLSRNNYEAAILGEFLANNYGDENPVQAQDGSYMAMAAYVQAFNDNEKARRRADQEVDVAQMENIATFLVRKWPGSDRAMDARLQLGTVYGQLKQHQRSADWYSQVPETASQFTNAQIRAGQAYWAAYIDGASKSAAEQPPKADLDGWMASAEKFLKNGIARAEKDTPAATPATDDLIAAKLSIVQILVSAGKYAECVKILTGQPHSIIEAIAVKDEKTRPKTGGVKSVEFASLAYQLLLRCYVGTQDLAKAQDTMKSLETIGGGGGEALTEMYRQIGQQLQDELERLKNQNQLEQFNTVRQSFQTFLGELSKRKDQTVGSLTWIGETYYGLAQSSNEDPGTAGSFYDQAATAYQTILDRAKEDPKFIDAARLTGVQLRLVNCKREKGSFEEALALVKTIIAANPRSLDAQVEANFIFQNWGASGQGDSWKKYQDAMAGDKASGLWGWVDTARRMEMLLAQGGADARDRYENRYYEARYNLTKCSLDLGLAQTGAKKTEALETAKTQVVSFVAITSDFSEEWWPKFDGLYREIQTGLGMIPEPLEKPKEYVAPVATENIASKTASAKNATKKPTTAKVTPKKEDDGTLTYAIFGIIALLGVGGGGFLVMKGTKTRKPSAAMASVAVDEPVIALPPVVAPRKKRAAAPQQGAAAAEPTGTPEKPKRPLTPEEKAILLRRRAAKAKAQEQAKKKQDGE
ncbi:MAG: tetratricopeptide repeat protein, partial [Rhodopirellula sp.]|nr:tetratricopeptide repeat protein [Rhodopirellula sp.]